MPHYLPVGAGPDLLRLPFRGGRQRVHLLLGGDAQLLGLPSGRGQQVLGLRLCLGPDLLDVGDRRRTTLVDLVQLHHTAVLGLGLSVGADRGGLRPRDRTQRIRLAPGGGGDLVSLLLGQPQHLRGPSAEAGVGGRLGLGDLLLEPVELVLELGDPFLEPGRRPLGLLARRFDRGHECVHGVPVVPTPPGERERRRRTDVVEDGKSGLLGHRVRSNS